MEFATRTGPHGPSWRCVMSTFDLFAEPRGRSAFLRTLIGLPMSGLQAFMAWRRRCEGIRLLLALDDRLLRDAGFIRAEIERLR